MSENLGFLDHATIAVNELEASRHFYGELLGLVEIPRRFYISAPGTWFLAGDREIHLLVRPNDDKLTGSYHIAFRCNDVAKKVSDLESAGVKISGYPSVRTDGTIQAYIEDPSGNRIELQQRPS
ncbi:MAG: VOC family protein [Chloroflexi bacterium]|nr:VOC family protein [Chloroflexota bacterium]